MALSKRRHRHSGVYAAVPGAELEYGCACPPEYGSRFDFRRAIGRRQRLDALPPRTLAADRSAGGRRMVLVVFALPVGRRIAGPPGAAGRGNTCVARLQPASLRSQRPGERAVCVAVGVGCGAHPDLEPGSAHSPGDLRTLASMKRTPPTFYFILLAGLTHVLISCVPDANDTHLNSQFFSSVQVIGTRGTGLGQFNKPRSVAVDLQDNVF